MFTAKVTNKPQQKFYKVWSCFHNVPKQIQPLMKWFLSMCSPEIEIQMVQILLETRWRLSLKLVRRHHLPLPIVYHIPLQRKQSYLIPHSVWALSHCAQLPSPQPQVLSAHLSAWKLCAPKSYIFNKLISQRYILQHLCGNRKNTGREKIGKINFLTILLFTFHI